MLTLLWFNRGRFKKLKQLADQQKKSLGSSDFMKTLKKTSDSTYLDAINIEGEELSSFNKSLLHAVNTPLKEARTE